MNISALSDIKIDYAEGLNRLGGNRELYDKLLLKFVDSTDLSSATSLLENKQYDALFLLLHNAKGVSGNLAITPFYEEVSLVVDRLRSHQYEDVPERLEACLVTLEAMKEDVR
ncbi:MAG TPA: hypothetical protein PKV44_01765 [Bacillota bacterium]|nr:hypothetical protein [Bacillota bacterium]HPE38921.1 hypothetical protein [Bacillota bacterium]